VALASDRFAGQREHAAVVSRHQSARAGAGPGARRRRAYREQRHHPISRAEISAAKARSGRPRERGRKLLKHEDDLHLDLRTLSFRFVFAPPGPPKSADALASYAANGTGTVQGVKDTEKQIQIEFWKRAAKEGFTDERARASAQRFRTEFEKLNRTLARQPYLLGETLSVLDIAWLIYQNRLTLAGYPFARLHPHVKAWADRLGAMPEFAKEIEQLRHSPEQLDAVRRSLAGQSLESVAGF
jgi:hypothetical protein